MCPSLPVEEEQGRKNASRLFLSLPSPSLLAAVILKPDRTEEKKNGAPPFVVSDALLREERGREGEFGEGPATAGVADTLVKQRRVENGVSRAAFGFFQLEVAVEAGAARAVFLRVRSAGGKAVPTGSLR